MNSLSEVNFSSSPSAQTAFKSAEYIWNDEDEPHRGNTGPLDMFKDGAGAYGVAKQEANGTKITEQAANGMKITEQAIDSSVVEGSPERGSSPDDSSPRSSVICRYYAGGYCSRGDKCFYSHDT